MSQPNIISSSAMPQQQIPAYPAGANSPKTAGIILQQQQNSNQMALIGKAGGSKVKRNRKCRKTMRKYKGGNPPVVKVPTVPAGTVNPQQTGNNYEELTKLSQLQAGQSVYDNTKTPSQVAGVAAQQQALYSGKTGGTKIKIKRKRKTKRRKIRGGNYPKWGCFSGGKRKTRK